MKSSNWRIGRLHPRGTESDSGAPVAWATCDSCGMIFDHPTLRFRSQWRGNKIETVNKLVCQRCLDDPQRQLGTLTLPNDGLPIWDARPERYDIDEIPISTRYTLNGNIRTVVCDTEGHRPPPYYDQRIIVYKGLPGPHLPLPVISRTAAYITENASQAYITEDASSLYVNEE